MSLRRAGSSLNLLKVQETSTTTVFAPFKVKESALESMSCSFGPAGAFYKSNKKQSPNNGFASVITTMSGNRFALVHRMGYEQATEFQKETGLKIPLACLRHIELGRGGIGKVRLALNITTNQWCAVKKMESHLGAKKEIIQLRQTSHIPNLVKFIDQAQIYYESKNKQNQPIRKVKHYIFMSLAAGENGLTTIKARHKPGVVDATLLNWAKNYTRIVANLHQHGLAHLDIKPNNFVHTPNGIELVDLGFMTNQTKADGSGTPSYMPPQYENQPLTSIHQDNFSLGLTLLCLKAGCSALELQQSDHCQLVVTAANSQRLTQLKPSFNHGRCHGLSQTHRYNADSLDGVIAKLLEVNPKQRLTSEQAFQHLQRIGPESAQDFN